MGHDPHCHPRGFSWLHADWSFLGKNGIGKSHKACEIPRASISGGWSTSTTRLQLSPSITSIVTVALLLGMAAVSFYILNSIDPVVDFGKAKLKCFADYSPSVKNTTGFNPVVNLISGLVCKVT